MKRYLMATLAALIIFSGILGPNPQADDAPSVFSNPEMSLNDGRRI